MGRRGELKRIRIEEVDDAGVARGPIRVNGVLPGEEVEVRIEHSGKRGVDYGSLVQVIEASPDRIDARCPHFLACGGCDFLHAPIAFQHHSKRMRIASALSVPIERVEPVIASPRELGYRALAKLVVGKDGTLGSYRPRTHDVVSMEGCLIHAPELEAIVEAARAWIAEHRGTLDLRYLVVRGSISEAKSVVTLVTRTIEAPGARELAKSLESRSDVARIVLHVNDEEGDTIFSTRGREDLLLDRGVPSERIGAVSQSLVSGAFAQVNPLAAGLLYALVAELIEPRDKRIADLYSGSGGMALTLAEAGAREVIGVETNGAAIRAARASATGLTNVCFVESSLETWTWPAERLDAVVLNPPRKGASPEVIDRIDAGVIVYVSCNPDSLARDLARLGGAIDRIVPVDLFPQTMHVETVVRVRR